MTASDRPDPRRPAARPSALAEALRRARQRLGLALAAGLLTGLVVIAAFQNFQGLRSLEAGLDDRLRVILAPQSAAQDPRLSILAVTEDTLALFPYRSPVDREFLAALIDLLAEAGAAAVGLDILIDQATEPAKDQALIEAIRRFPGPVITAWADERAGLRPQQQAWLAEFVEASGAVPGFATVTYDRDGVVRRFDTALPDSPVRSFPAALLEALGGTSDPPSGLIDWRREAADGAPAFQILPSHALLNPALPQAMFKGWFGGRIVMIGADLEQTDRHQTSLAVDPTISNRTNAGVLLHAHVLSQLLDTRSVRSWALPARAGQGVTMGLALAGALIGISALSPLLKLGGLAFAGFGWLGLTAALAMQGGPFLPVAPPLLALGVTFGLGAAAEAFLSGREKAFIRQAFSHYLEPAMVDRLARDRSSLRLGGERREISFIFTDVAGFTDMSEALAPEDLADLLNGYFDGMADIIARHDGAIDKFIGDAVVVLFGALTPDPDHPLNAIRCAVEMDAFAETYRRANARRGLGVTRIGVHTGEASVGNFGGRKRFDYTAMGDAMNTAARLESANKPLGTRICISDACRQAAEALATPAKPLPVLRPVGRVRLKGKAEPVAVWNHDPDLTPAEAAAYARAHALLDAPEAARDAFARLAAEGPPDPLVALHLTRLRAGAAGALID